MEPIKITDKLTLRQEALRLSVTTGTNYPISQAQQFEAYLSGDSDLPERDNSMETYLYEMKDMLTKQHNPWISADDEMKPAKGVQVLCALYYAVNNIVYEVMYYDPDEKVWYGGADDDNNNHVVAWHPIQPYSPTL